MTNDEDDGNKPSPPDDQGLSKEAIEQTKAAILHGVGYGRPPPHTRFKKGQSGNPRGRPRTVDRELRSDRSANAIALREGERLISVREGSETRQMPAIEAVFRKQYATALGGSAYALKHATQRYDWAERERRRQISEDVELYEYYVAMARQEIAEAKAKGEPAPDRLPHPDDVVIDRETGVTFIGPCTEDGRALLEENMRYRDVLIMQHSLNERMAGTDRGDRLDQRSSALAFAQAMNNSLPRRHQLSDLMFMIRMGHYDAWPKRKLLKEVCRAWRALGVPLPRGCTFPPLRLAKQRIDKILEDLTSGNNEAMAGFLVEPRHVQIDAIGLTRRRLREEGK